MQTGERRDDLLNKAEIIRDSNKTVQTTGFDKRKFGCYQSEQTKNVTFKQKQLKTVDSSNLGPYLIFHISAIIKFNLLHNAIFLDKPLMQNMRNQ